MPKTAGIFCVYIFALSGGENVASIIRERPYNAHRRRSLPLQSKNKTHKGPERKKESSRC
jgi:hypothetical protein